MTISSPVACCLALALLLSAPARSDAGVNRTALAQTKADARVSDAEAAAASTGLTQSKMEPFAADSRKAPNGLGLVQEESMSSSVEFRKCAAEFIAMTLFVFFGCGSAMSIAKEPGSAWVLQVALTFGLAITVLAYSIGHYSGGEINCAVTFGLMISGKVTVAQAICNFIAQMLGSTFGAAILKVMYPTDKDLTGGLGTNGVSPGWSQGSALIGEVLGTFLLMFTVLETAVNPLSASNRSVACLAIGLSVFLAHSLLIPVDGCSINPTRSFGPALVQSISGKGAQPFADHWVFWIGPIIGSAIGAGVHAAISA